MSQLSFVILYTRGVASQRARKRWGGGVAGGEGKASGSEAHVAQHLLGGARRVTTARRLRRPPQGHLHTSASKV
jgi:hypothetical protein